MICFAIALRSPKTTDHWTNVLEDFNNTLRSIYNQTNPEFEVYVGCNEIPELSEPYDSRLHFVTDKLPLPQNWTECCRDRSWKLLMCAREIKRDYKRLVVHKGGAFVFPVDADDLVNRNIAQWCADHPDANGFKSKTGYRWHKGDRYVTITKYFGGTMNIMKMYPEDLPDEIPDSSTCLTEATSVAMSSKYPIRWIDWQVEDKFRKMGRPLETLPFRSTVYVLGTGENISSNDPSNKPATDRFHPVAYLRKINPLDKRVITKRFRTEFGMKM